MKQRGFCTNFHIGIPIKLYITKTVLDRVSYKIGNLSWGGRVCIRISHSAPIFLSSLRPAARILLSSLPPDMSEDLGVRLLILPNKCPQDNKVLLSIWAALCFVAGCTAVGCALAQTEGVGLGVALLLASAFLVAAVCTLHRINEKPVVYEFTNLDRLARNGSLLIIFGWAVLFCMLVVRLFSVKQFGGSWAGLNFGLKANSGKQNRAFTADPETVGHFIQGVLSCLLFPHIDPLFFGKTGSQERNIGLILWCVKEAVVPFVVVYPVYNIIKRGIKTASQFATSSFCNNGMEWALGFLVGLSLGLLLSVTAVVADKNNAALRVESQRKSMPRFSFWSAVARVVAGVLLFCSGVAAAILNGLSWDNVSPTVGTHNDNSDTAITILFLAILVIFFVPLVVFLTCGQKKRSRFRRDSKSAILDEGSPQQLNLELGLQQDTVARSEQQASAQTQI